MEAMNAHVRRTATLLISAAIVTGFIVACAAGSAAHASPPLERSPLERLDQATAEAVVLQERITALEAERVALAGRRDVMEQRIAEQREVVEAARRRLDITRRAYSDRIVSVYKRGTAEPLALLLGANSIQDFLARSTLLGRISVKDKDLWKQAAVDAAEARYQESLLEQLLYEEEQLSRANSERRQELRTALARQDALIRELTDEAREYLAALQAEQERTRQEWATSSRPLDRPIPRREARVVPYDGAFLVTDGNPTEYRSTGESFDAVCSWYGPGFHGRTTASGQVFNENDFTCASRTLPFGTRLALTRGDRRIVVTVTDRGPFIDGRDLDLSKAAAEALGFSGVATVHAEFVTARATE